MEYIFNLNINKEISVIENKIIEQYWKFDGTEFENKPSIMKKEFEISQYELNKIIKEHSFLEINKGGCIECGLELTHTVTSQSQFKEKINSTIIHCEECREAYNQKQKQERELNRISYRNQNLQKALEYRLWEKLEPIELKILKNILIIKDRDTIFKKVFSQDYQGTWSIVNKLEKIGLIEVLRDESSVIGFDFLDELENQILNFNEQIETFSETRTNLSFSLSKKLNKYKPSQPDYSGVFVLPTDVILKKGIEYIYGGWTQTDGSINLKFTPKDEVFNVLHKDIDQEPEHIKDVISNMFNKITENETITDFADDLEDEHVSF